MTRGKKGALLAKRPLPSNRNRAIEGAATVKLILMGNAGSGKSTLAQRLASESPAARLSLDEVAFEAGTATRRPLDQSTEDVRQFIAANNNWIIEGCYADIINAILDQCDTLIFLNPGTDTCVAHCRARPWEPDKFSSKQEQDAHLENLIAWVRDYETRTDEYGLYQHRALFDAFTGAKLELKEPSAYETASRQQS